MGGLAYSDRPYWDPSHLIRKIKIEGNSINEREQKDAYEFLTILMDQIEFGLKSTPQSSLIKNIFMGTLSNEIICKDCPHKSENLEPLLVLILNVKNHKSIYESLSEFVKGETLEGENAYYCEKCEKKVKALKRSSIKNFPNNLIIVLKRFEFNLETMYFKKDKIQSK